MKPQSERKETQLVDYCLDEDSDSFDRRDYENRLMRNAVEHISSRSYSNDWWNRVVLPDKLDKKLDKIIER